MILRKPLINRTRGKLSFTFCKFKLLQFEESLLLYCFLKFQEPRFSQTGNVVCAFLSTFLNILIVFLQRSVGFYPIAVQNRFYRQSGKCRFWSKNLPIHIFNNNNSWARPWLIQWRSRHRSNRTEVKTRFYLIHFNFYT